MWHVIINLERTQYRWEKRPGCPQTFLNHLLSQTIEGLASSQSLAHQMIFCLVFCRLTCCFHCQTGSCVWGFVQDQAWLFYWTSSAMWQQWWDYVFHSLMHASFYIRKSYMTNRCVATIYSQDFHFPQLLLFPQLPWGIDQHRAWILHWTGSSKLKKRKRKKKIWKFISIYGPQDNGGII